MKPTILALLILNINNTIHNIFLFIIVIPFIVFLVCKEALEDLTIALVLNPSALGNLMEDKSWQTFIIDLVLRCSNRWVKIFSFLVLKYYLQNYLISLRRDRYDVVFLKSIL